MAANVSRRWVALLLSMVPVTGFAFILWGASFFQRVHGMDKTETGFWLGGAMAAGLVIGNLVAGWVSDRYGKANPGFNGWFVGIGLLISFPFGRSEEHTSELQSLMRISYAVFCLKTKKNKQKR